ncbi:MAG: hypothetical protein DRJ64_01305 [Thermoprotei archaeon]|nr:MAG: hypothetical protein DRJ64_01305 [Thermoprotei archaeon]
MGKIFRNRDKLSYKYIPEKLPHREKQLGIFISVFDDLLSGEKIDFPRTLQFVGVVGSGKTSSSIVGVRKLGEEIRKYGLTLKHIYVNLKIEATSPFLLYKTLMEKVSMSASRSLSAEELLSKFVKKISKLDYLLFLTFDEVDFFVRKESKTPGIIYDISRFYEILNSNGIKSNIVGITFISRSVDWLSYLNPAEASTIGALSILYPPYSKEQIVDILEYRISESLYENTVSEDVLEYIAEITSIYRNGDIRYALDILLYSGIIAEYEGFSKITLDHVRKAIGKNLFYSGDIQYLTLEEKSILLATIRSIQESKRMYVPLSLIRKNYELLTETLPIRRLNEDSFELSIQKLVNIGALEFKGLTRITVSPAVDEKILLEKIKQELKKIAKN